MCDETIRGTFASIFSNSQTSLSMGISQMPHYHADDVMVLNCAVFRLTETGGLNGVNRQMGRKLTVNRQKRNIFTVNRQMSEPKLAVEFLRYP